MCGQDTKREPPTVAEYLHELFEHFAQLDSKVLRTFASLLFLPGKLPGDYLANKRARYVKPLKVYLTTIALAFTAVQVLGWDLGLRFEAPGFSVNFYLMQQTPPTTIAQGKPIVDSIPLILEYVDLPGIRRFKALPPDEQLIVMQERGIHYLPYLVLGLVPIYAALLQWVYRARRWRFGAHLVFGLYVHSFFLLIFVIEAKLPMVVATLLSIWAIVYYAFALKRVYGGTWTETMSRGALLTILYAIAVLAIGLPVTAVLLSI